MSTEGTGFIFHKFKERILQGECDLRTDTIRVSLLSSWTQDMFEEVWSDISAQECSGGGYVQQIVGNSSEGRVSLDSTDTEAVFDAEDVTFASLDVGTPAWAVMWDDDASDALIAAWYLSTTASNGGDYTLQWNSEGILNLG
jgi:hypothetical protein